MLRRLLDVLTGRRRKPEMTAMPPGQFVRMVRMIAETRPDEIGCDDCFAQLDQFVELHMAGKNAAEAMPLVQDHLDRCRDCREEFEVLLASLQAEPGETDS
jgi:hypothetical protein